MAPCRAALPLLRARNRRIGTIGRVGGGVFDNAGNRISAARGRMRVRMRRNAGARFFMNFWWMVANLQCANVSSVESSERRGCGPVRRIGPACRAAMRVFRLRIFIDSCIRADMQCAALTRNSDRQRLNAHANRAAIAHSASIAAPGSVYRRDVLHIVPIPRCASSPARSRERIACAAGRRSGGRVFTDRHAFRPRFCGVRRLAPVFRPRPAGAGPCQVRPVSATIRFRRGRASGGGPASYRRMCRPAPGGRVERWPIGARDRHGGEHACQKNIGSWYWTTIRRCAPG